MLKHRPVGEAGSAILELALVVPMLAFVLIGAAELGRIAYAAIEVSNAARAAVAFAAQGPTTAMQTGTIASGTNDAIALAARNEAPNVTDLVTTATETCICETINTTTGAITQNPITGACGGSLTTASAQCTADATTAGAGYTGNVVDYVNVTTTATVKTMFNYNWNGLGIPRSFTLNGYAQMRLLQN